jgi:C2 domain
MWYVRILLLLPSSPSVWTQDSDDDRTDCGTDASMTDYGTDATEYIDDGSDAEELHAEEGSVDPAAPSAEHKDKNATSRKKSKRKSKHGGSKISSKSGNTKKHGSESKGSVSKRDRSPRRTISTALRRKSTTDQQSGSDTVESDVDVPSTADSTTADEDSEPQSPSECEGTGAQLRKHSKRAHDKKHTKKKQQQRKQKKDEKDEKHHRQSSSLSPATGDGQKAARHRSPRRAVSSLFQRHSQQREDPPLRATTGAVVDVPLTLGAEAVPLRATTPALVFSQPPSSAAQPPSSSESDSQRADRPCAPSPSRSQTVSSCEDAPTEREQSLAEAEYAVEVAVAVDAAGADEPVEPAELVEPAAPTDGAASSASIGHMDLATPMYHLDEEPNAEQKPPPSAAVPSTISLRTSTSGLDLDLDLGEGHPQEQEQQEHAPASVEPSGAERTKPVGSAGEVHLRVARTAPGRLRVLLVECANLDAKDRGKSSDPYVKLQLCGQKERSATIKKTLHPHYDAEFLFTDLPAAQAVTPVSGVQDAEGGELAQGVRDLLQLDVFDWDRVGKHSFIGQVSVPVPPFGAADLDQWLVLNRTKRSKIVKPSKSASSGKRLLFKKVKIKRSRSKPVVALASGEGDGLPPAALAKNAGESAAGGAGGEDVVDLRRCSGEIHTRIHWRQRGETTLVVNVVACRTLDAKDKNGYSDPYVKLILGDSHEKTKVVHKNLNPQFNEEFTLLRDPGVQQLVLEVWDWDRVGGDDFIGRVLLPVDSFSTEMRDQWSELFVQEKNRKRLERRIKKQEKKRERDDRKSKRDMERHQSKLVKEEQQKVRFLCELVSA